MGVADVEEVFRDALPPTVTVRAGKAAPVDAPQPTEAALVERAIDRRRAEFLTGRALARAALLAFGVRTDAIGRGEHREPLWPAGTTGSITHTAGVCVAAAARSTDLLGIGIDLERRDRDMSGGVIERIAPHPGEPILRDRFGDDWPLAVFSTKEAIYKALHPTVGEIFGFGEVELTWVDDRLEARCGDWLRDRVGHLPAMQVSCTVTGEHVHSVAFVPSAAEALPHNRR